MTDPLGTQNAYLALADRYRHDRVGFVRNVLGAEPDDWQREVLEGMDRGERRISVRSGHGVGKSTLAGWISCHSLTCYGNAKVIETAPSGPQLWDALFAETKMWFNRLPDALRELFKLGTDRIESVAAPEQLFVSARTSRAETPEAMQGVHAEGGIVVLIADEASGIPDAVFEAGSGSMSGHNCFTLLFSNPTRITGFFYDTHHSLKGMWLTKHVSCLNCKRVSADYIEDMKARYSEGSNAYRVRVLGEFPLKDDQSYIALDLVEAAQLRDIAIDPQAEVVWGVDVARFGNDKSVLTKRRGKVVIEAQKYWKGYDTMQLTGAIKHEYDAAAVADRPRRIFIDVIGIGAGVVDRLGELLPGIAVGINVAESPSFTPDDRFERLRDELWSRGRDWLSARDCRLPSGDDGFAELAMPFYAFKSNGCLKIESKVDFKKRHKFSPDHADSFLLTFAADAAAGGGSCKRSDWNKPIKRNLKGIV